MTTTWPYTWPATTGLGYDEAVWTAVRAASAVQFPGDPPLPRQTLEEWCQEMAVSRRADRARYVQQTQTDADRWELLHHAGAELRQAAADGHLHPTGQRGLRPPAARRPPVPRRLPTVT